MPPISAKFTADVSDFRAKLEQAQTTVKAFDRTTAQVNRELTKFGNEFSGAKTIRQLESMAKAVEEVGGVARLTEAQQRRLASAVEEGLAQYRALGEEAPAAVRKLNQDLQGTVVAQERATAAAAKARDQWVSSMGAVGSGLTQAGTILTAAVSAPIVAGFGLSVKAAKDFESSYANVIKTVNDSRINVDAFGRLTPEAQKLRQELLGLSRDIPVTASGLSTIAAIGGQFGVARQDIVAFTDTVARLGVAVDGISAESAAASLAQIRQIAGASTTEFDRLASAVVELGNNGTSTEASILEMSKRFASAGTLAGLTAAEILGVSASLANLGVESEAGGTALSKTFGDIGAAVAKGGADLKAFADVAGVSANTFASTWKRSAVEAFDLFLKGLREGQAAGRDMTVVLAELGVTEIRQSNALRVLALNQEAFAGTVRMSTDAYRDNTALAEEARKKYATFENQLQLFTNRITEVGIELGGPMLQALRAVLDASEPVLDVVVDLARRFAEMPASVQAATFALAGVTATAPLFLVLTGTVLQSVSAILTFRKELQALQLAQAAASATGLATASTGLSGSLVGLSGAAAAAGSALGTAGLFAAFIGLQGFGAKLALEADTFNERLLAQATDAGRVVIALRDMHDWVVRLSTVLGEPDPFGRLVHGARDFSTLSGEMADQLGNEVSGAFSRFQADVADAGVQSATTAETIAGPFVSALRKAQEWAESAALAIGESFRDALLRSIPGLSTFVQLAPDLSTWKTWLGDLHQSADLTREIAQQLEAMSKIPPPKLPTIAPPTFDKDFATDRLYDGLFPTNVEEIFFGQLARMRTEFDKVASGGGVLAQQLARVREEVEKLSAAQKAEIKAGTELGYDAKKIAEELAKKGAAMAASEAAIKLYQQSQREAATSTRAHAKEIREQERALREAEAAARKHEAALSAIDQQLRKFGIVTLHGVNTELAAIQSEIGAAVAAGVPLDTVLAAMHTRFENLAAAAKKSKVGVGEVAATLSTLTAIGGIPVLDTFERFSGGTLPQATRDLKELEETTLSQILAQEELNSAYDYFGLKTPEALRRAAAEAERNFALLLQSGTATSQQLHEAYEGMVEAQRAALGKMPGAWDVVKTSAVESIGTIGEAFANHLAGMLTFTESFGEGFQNVLRSVQRGFQAVLADMLLYYQRQFVAKLVSSFAGDIGGGWAKSLANAIGGGGGGGSLESRGVNWAANAMGLGGGGGAAASTYVLPGVGSYGGTIGVTTTSSGSGLGSSGSIVAANNSGAGSAGAGGGFMPTLAGGAVIGGAGLGLGLVGQQIFGGSGFKAAGFGAATGAGAGAALGTAVFPGVGTIAGLVIGGLAGAIGGLVGKSVSEKVNDARDKFVGQFGPSGTGKGTGFGNLTAAFAELDTLGLGGSKLFQELFKSKNFDDFNRGVKNTVAALQSAEYVTYKVTNAFHELGTRREDMVRLGAKENGALAATAGAYAELANKAKAAGATLPEGLQPVIDKLTEMGLLVQKNGQLVEDTTKTSREAFRTVVPNALFEQIARVRAELAKGLTEAGKTVDDAVLDRMAAESQEVLDFVRQRAGTVASGLAAMSAPVLAEVEKLKATRDEAPEDEPGIEEAKAAAAGAGSVAKTAGELADLGTIAMGAFGAARAAGLGYWDALKQIGPGLDGLIKAQKDLGLSLDESTIAPLAHFRDLANQFPALVQAADALVPTMRGLVDLGGLNTETLAAMERQGLATYDKLRAAGFSESETLSMMKDYLLEVIEKHQELGQPIDENTGKLIEQADQLGLLRRDGKTTTDVLDKGFSNLLLGINTLISTLGGVPVKFDDIGKAIDRIPKEVTTTVTGVYRPPQIPGESDYERPEPDSPAYAARGGLVTSRGVRYMAGGGEVAFESRGIDTVPAMLAIGERVLTRDENRAYETLLKSPARDFGSPASQLRAPSVHRGPTTLHSTIVMPNGMVLAEVVSKAQPFLLGAYGVRRR